MTTSPSTTAPAGAKPQSPTATAPETLPSGAPAPAAPGAPAATRADQTVAVVGKVKIVESQVEPRVRLIGDLPLPRKGSAAYAVVWERALAALVREEVLRQEAGRLGVSYSTGAIIDAAHQAVGEEKLQAELANRQVSVDEFDSQAIGNQLYFLIAHRVAPEAQGAALDRAMAAWFAKVGQELPATIVASPPGS